MKNVLALFLLLPLITYAQDGAFLDSAYSNLQHPKADHGSMNKANPRNNVEAIIGFQSPIRSQQSRGTCSIFSATAYLEGLLIKKGQFNATINLSEEWLQYTAVRNKTSDGSYAGSNFEAIRRYGMPSEQTLPYIGEDWVTGFSSLKEDRCGHLKGNQQTSCYIVHRDPKLLGLADQQILDQNAAYYDPEFVAARTEAYQFRNDYISFTNTYYNLNNITQIKNTLLQGYPVILEIDFFYGAWNHRKADEMGIGRDMNQWSQGIVGNPEPGSMDAQESPKKPAGHSILVVGFDDNKIVKKTIKMADGSMKTFSYKGVYYFKNSWGSDSFGRDFEIDGVNYPGYGMIVQKHAHSDGAFYFLPLQ
ncbi:MAG: hypothetical protein COW00_15100 [Bdellovibrio sp. CG12_big_fil_rev_8_21_14_0_65_39_13]|nr:MAG: hypothetical protein COW78_00655 [Bdellovibrio sp. CG22_combo_CG10-13_8_21_14_all_39_27]PIQ58619.1 MAG: hypothetical protein COW00_15100 [Bdellovibrio sp. CG12_big_fil_rev_8_21_14_0_65_39_13]PIR33827.1 MAG: hypothetical protein COV37_15060 [Bdellovibrio sp. CG11_big_fil_rev_8_21_14_0_20_39_38]